MERGQTITQLPSDFDMYKHAKWVAAREMMTKGHSAEYHAQDARKAFDLSAEKESNLAKELKEINEIISRPSSLAR